MERGNRYEVRGLFSFLKDNPKEEIEVRFNVWVRYFFPQFFSSEDAPFHSRIDIKNIEIYKGEQSAFLNIAFRGSAKTTRTKLFIAFAIANDEGYYRKYFKSLSKEITNSKQNVTDIYNLLITHRNIYPEIFEKTEVKREETMASFTTSTGVKVISDSIGTDQRGDIQDESRPDFLWFDDFETRLSLMSAAITNKIWLNMDEAVQGLAKDGGRIYTCNYISERGNVHKLIGMIENKINIPIEEGDKPTWSRYTKDEIAVLKKNAEDYEGDYLGKPSAGKDIYFDRESVDKQTLKVPIDEIAGLKIFRKYDPSHRVGGGMDVGGGVGLDSSTSVYLDFDCNPIQVIATYKNNEIKPDSFAYEIARQGKRFGECYVAPEKNYGSTVDILKTIYPTDKIHKTQPKPTRIYYGMPTEFGYDTNVATKNKDMADLSQVIESGTIELNDPDLIEEVKSYTRGDLIDKEADPRLTTRHFDLLRALAIALQTNSFIKKPEKPSIEDYWRSRLRPLVDKPKKSKNPAR